MSQSVCLYVYMYIKTSVYIYFVYVNALVSTRLGTVNELPIMHKLDLLTNVCGEKHKFTSLKITTKNLNAKS